MKKPINVIWIGEQASCGDKWGMLWNTFEIEDGSMGYAFLDSNKMVVTKKYKTKPAAKRAAEKWLREPK